MYRIVTYINELLNKNVRNKRKNDVDTLNMCFHSSVIRKIVLEIKFLTIELHRVHFIFSDKL